MKRIFFGADGRLRNGVWMLVFVALFLLSRVAYAPLAAALRPLGAGTAMLSTVQVGLVLLVTWLCLLLRRQPLASVGLRLGRQWLMEAGAGLLLGCAAVALAVALMGLAGGMRLQLDPARSLAAVLSGFYLFAMVALLEELLFRGFLFQRLVDGIGLRAALFGMAALFAASHWGNPDMQGAALLVATVEIALGALLLGLAWWRTRSLALPVGLHLGWNWMQGQVFGFDVSGFDQPGWFEPQFGQAPAWLTGGAFGLEASVCAIASDLVMLWLVWRWRGTPAAAMHHAGRLAIPVGQR